MYTCIGNSALMIFVRLLDAHNFPKWSSNNILFAFIENRIFIILADSYQLGPFRLSSTGLYSCSYNLYFWLRNKMSPTSAFGKYSDFIVMRPPLIQIFPGLAPGYRQ